MEAEEEEEEEEEIWGERRSPTFTFVESNQTRENYLRGALSKVVSNRFMVEGIHLNESLLNSLFLFLLMDV